MSLKETYLGNVENVKKANPDAVLIDVTRRAGSVLSPSWEMLNEYKTGKMTWDGYISRFVKEMDNTISRAEMLRIGELARTKDVFLVCFERFSPCHRFLLVDMIVSLLLEESCKQLNRLVIERPDLVETAYMNISKELRAEA
ncbi:MAG: DUF488 family protein [Candidatus Methanoperedens sp.]|nr:DUF488 family protein [Candidatus Methanoperedens sp.]